MLLRYSVLCIVLIPPSVEKRPTRSCTFEKTDNDFFSLSLDPVLLRFYGQDPTFGRKVGDFLTFPFQKSITEESESACPINKTSGRVARAQQKSQHGHREIITGIFGKHTKTMPLALEKFRSLVWWWALEWKLTCITFVHEFGIMIMRQEFPPNP